MPCWDERFPKCFMKQVLITDQASSDRQECDDMSARMLHSGHHRDKKNAYFPWGRKKRSWCHKECGVCSEDQRNLSPSLSCKAAFLQKVFHNPLKRNFLWAWDPSPVREHLQPLLATAQFSTSSCSPLSRALGHCPGAKHIESLQQGNRAH